MLKALNGSPTTATAPRRGNLPRDRFPSLTEIKTFAVINHCLDDAAYDASRPTLVENEQTWGTCEGPQYIRLDLLQRARERKLSNEQRHY